MAGYSNKLLIICVFVVTCKGDDISCPGCSEISCEQIKCSPSEYCFMQAVQCVSAPCPKLPSCIAASKICKGDVPIVDDTGGVTTCLDSCPLTHDCVEGFCCGLTASILVPVTPDLGETDIDKDTIVDGNLPPPFFNEELFGNKQEPKPCTPCVISLCMTSMCPEHSGAQCVQDNCSCSSWFEDANGKIVDCFNDIDLFENASTKPSSTHSVPPLKLSKEPPITLESTKDNEDNTWIYVVVAVCIVLVLCSIGFLVYKVMESKRERKREDVSLKQQEQKLPLSPVLSDNNNESSKRLINGKEDRPSASTEDV